MSTLIKRGRLTLIEMTELRSPRSGSLWKCVCDCGKTVIKPYKNTYLGQSCGCLKKEVQTKRRKGESVTINYCYRNYKASSRSRNLEPISKEEWLKIVFNKCYYCQAVDTRSFSNKKHIPPVEVNINGIDRLDPSRGYEADNIVPCCWKCNKMKLNYDLNEFISQTEKIYNHLKL